MTSRRPLVLELGGNTILFRLLTKPSFCSFPLLDDRKAPNGGICTEREEVSEEHEELNKIKLFYNCARTAIRAQLFSSVPWPLVYPLLLLLLGAAAGVLFGGFYHFRRPCSAKIMEKLREIFPQFFRCTDASARIGLGRGPSF